MRLAILGWSLTFLPVVGVLAIMPDETYEEARRQASLHLQVEVVSVTRPERTPGECKVEGKVATIFRDETGILERLTEGLAKIRKDDRITFSIACAGSDDELVPSGVWWQDVERLANAEYLEVYLNRDSDGYEVALWQSKIIDAPTAEPEFPVSQ